MAKQMRKPEEATSLIIKDREGKEVKLPAELQETIRKEIVRSIASKIPEMQERGIDARGWWEGSHSWD